MHASQGFRLRCNASSTARCGTILAADLAETRETTGDGQEAFLVQEAHVTRRVPAVAKHLRGQFGFVEITFHDVGAADEHQTLLGSRHVDSRLGIPDANLDTGEEAAPPSRSFYRLLEPAGLTVPVRSRRPGGRSRCSRSPPEVPGRIVPRRARRPPARASPPRPLHAAG